MLLIDKIAAAAGNPVNLLMTAGDKKTRQNHGAALRVMVRNAKRYYIDEDVTRAATRLGLDNPEALHEILTKMARPPQEKVWIEWHNRVFIEESGEAARDDAPEFTGCFIEAIDDFYPMFRLTVAGTMPESNRVVVSPLSYVWRCDDQPMPVSEDMPFISKITGFKEEFFRKAVVGTAFEEARKKAKEFTDKFIMDRRMEMLTQQCATEMTPLTRQYLKSTSDVQVADYLKSDAIESAGTWRFIICVLSLIAAREFVHSEPSVRSNKPALVGGKMVPNVVHRVVSLKVPRAIVLEKITKKFSDDHQSISRAQHDVEGYWATSHIKGDFDCSHVYDNETPNRLVCRHCGKKRWHVRSHTRGNPEVGIIFKTRRVEAKKGKR